MSLAESAIDSISHVTTIHNSAPSGRCCLHRPGHAGGRQERGPFGRRLQPGQVFRKWPGRALLGDQSGDDGHHPAQTHSRTLVHRRAQALRILYGSGSLTIGSDLANFRRRLGASGRDDYLPDPAKLAGVAILASLTRAILAGVRCFSLDSSLARSAGGFRCQASTGSAVSAAASSLTSSSSSTAFRAATAPSRRPSPMALFVGTSRATVKAANTTP